MLGRSKVARLLIAAGLALLLALLIFTPALAADVTQGEDITIDEDTTDDVYAFGKTVTVNATINGDLVAFASTVTINGTVTGDVIFGGQLLIINGTVEDDVRGVGYLIQLGDNGVIADDLNAGGYSIEMKPASRIGGDVFFGAYQASLADIDGNVIGGSNGVRIGGRIGGDVELSVGADSSFDPMMFMQNPDLPTVERIPAGLTFGQDGHIAGNLDYSAERELSIPDGAIDGQVIFTQADTRPEARAAVEPAPRRIGDRPGVRFIGYFVGSFVVLLLVAAIFRAVAPTFFHGALDTLRSRWAASLGVGVLGYLIVFVVLPLLAFFVIVLLFAPTLGMAARLRDAFSFISVAGWTGFSLVTGWIAPILVATLLGGAIYGLFDREKKSSFWGIVIGLLIVTFLLAIPVLGRFLLTMLVGMFGLGAVILYLWPRPKQATAVAAPVEGTPSV
jgi:hypothetical protein